MQKRLDSLLSRNVEQTKISEVTAELNEYILRRAYLKTKIIERLETNKESIRSKVNELMQENYSYDKQKPASFQEYQTEFAELETNFRLLSRAGNTVKLTKAASIIADELLLLKYIIEDITNDAFSTQGFRIKNDSGLTPESLAVSAANTINNNSFKVAKESQNTSKNCGSACYNPNGQPEFPVNGCSSRGVGGQSLFKIIDVYDDQYGPNLSLVIAPNDFDVHGKPGVPPGFENMRNNFSGTAQIKSANGNNVKINPQVNYSCVTSQLSCGNEYINANTSGKPVPGTNKRNGDKGSYTIQLGALDTIPKDSNGNYTDNPFMDKVGNSIKNHYGIGENENFAKGASKFYSDRFFVGAIDLKDTYNKLSSGQQSSDIINLQLGYDPKFPQHQNIKLKMSLNGGKWKIECAGH